MEEAPIPVIADIVKLISEKFDNLLWKIADFGLLPNGIIEHMIKHTKPEAKWFSVFVVSTALKSKIDSSETIITEDDFHTEFVNDIYTQLKSTMKTVSVDEAHKMAEKFDNAAAVEKLPQFLTLLDINENDIDMKACSKELAESYEKLVAMNEEDLKSDLDKFSRIFLEYLKMFVHLCLQDKHWKENRFTEKWVNDKGSFHTSRVFVD